MDNKEKVVEMYKKAAEDAYNALLVSKDTEYGSPQRELFAEKYGRRQAYARVLRELYDVRPEELQRILDDLSGGKL